MRRADLGDGRAEQPHDTMRPVRAALDGLES
jgi:hypothetical protein